MCEFGQECGYMKLLIFYICIYIYIYEYIHVCCTNHSIGVSSWFLVIHLDSMKPLTYFFWSKS